MLVELAQQRNEPIPALLYNSSIIAGVGMAKDGYERFDSGSYAVSVAEEESDHEEEGGEGEGGDSTGVKEEMKKEAEVRVDNEKGGKRGREKEEEEEWAEEERRSVKLGLGDFVFYSVLVGRAAMYDIVTVFTCFIGIVAGLFATLVLLTIYRQVSVLVK